jgi:hypothetical protein
MERLLRWLNARTFLYLVAAAGGVFLADRYQGLARLAYENAVRPVERGPRVLPSDLLQELDARESLKLISLHRTVSAELAAAKAKGFDVAKLQAAADSALGLNVPKYRAAAMERLNKLRLAIPQGQSGVRPATLADEASDSPKIPKPSLKRSRRRR